MSFEQLVVDVNDFIEEQLGDNFTVATPEQMTALRKVIDPRALPGRIWFDSDTMIVENGSGLRMLNYYGGFEYVDADNRTEIGSYTAFSGECSRVSELLDVLLDVAVDEEECE